MFNPEALSPAGARGLMQIMPAAAQDHSGALGFTGNASDLNKPEVNLAFGQRHLDMLRNQPGTQGLLPKVMAAYNAGEGAVDKYKGVPPFKETRLYVQKVLALYGHSTHPFDDKAGKVSPLLGKAVN